MLYKQIPNTDLKISIFSLGTWLTLGHKISTSEFQHVFDYALGLGINYFDTADSYNKGLSELELGKLIKNKTRSDLIIGSKVFFDVETESKQGLSENYINQAIDASLNRLKTDYIDIYQCHRFDNETTIEEISTTMHSLILKGKIKHWGVGRWNLNQIESCINLCKNKGITPPIINQDVYNLFNRKPETRTDTLSFLGYSPLARGVLTNKYLNTIPGNSRGADVDLKCYLYDLDPEKLNLVSSLAKIADKYHCSITQLVLSYYTNIPSITSVILGAKSKHQIQENIDSLNTIILPEDLTQISNLFSKFK